MNDKIFSQVVEFVEQLGNLSLMTEFPDWHERIVLLKFYLLQMDSDLKASAVETVVRVFSLTQEGKSWESTDPDCVERLPALVVKTLTESFAGLPGGVPEDSVVALWAKVMPHEKLAIHQWVVHLARLCKLHASRGGPHGDSHASDGLDVV